MKQCREHGSRRQSRAANGGRPTGLPLPPKDVVVIRGAHDGHANPGDAATRCCAAPTTTDARRDDGSARSRRPGSPHPTNNRCSHRGQRHPSRPGRTTSRARPVPDNLAGHWCHHREPYSAAAPLLVRTEHGAQQQTNSERERTHERLPTALLFIVPYLGTGVSAAPPGSKPDVRMYSSAGCSGSKTYNFCYLHQTTHSNDKKRKTLARHDRSIKDNIVIMYGSRLFLPEIIRQATT